MLNYFALIMQKTIQSNLDAYYDQNGIILPLFKVKQQMKKLIIIKKIRKKQPDHMNRIFDE